MRKEKFTTALAVVLLLAACIFGTAAAGEKNELVLATTTSVQDTGLLDILLPVFEKESACTVKVVAVGSGAALRMGKDGNADVLFVHDPAAEEAALKGGYVTNQRFVMSNDFILVGPPGDPAGVKVATSASSAFKAIAEKKALFVSRADQSGTHKKELEIWKEAGVKPEGACYIEAGSGMGATLRIASEKQAYCLSDRATFTALKKNLGLSLLFSDPKKLYNPYHVLLVNPKGHPAVHAALALKFSDFLLSPKVQKRIGEFGKDKFGGSLFHPATEK